MPMAFPSMIGWRYNLHGDRHCPGSVSLDRSDHQISRACSIYLIGGCRVVTSLLYSGDDGRSLRDEIQFSSLTATVRGGRAHNGHEWWGSRFEIAHNNRIRDSGMLWQNLNCGPVPISH